MALAALSRRSIALLALLALLLIAAATAYVQGWLSWSPYAPRRNAETAAAAGDFEKALAEIDRCVEHWPNDPATLLAAARLHRRTEDWNGAALLRRRALDAGAELDRVAFEERLQRAQVSHPAEQEASLLEIARRKPQDASLVHEALAFGYASIDDLTAASRHAEAWSQLQPDNWQPHFLRGVMLERAQSFDDAIKDYAEAAKRAPGVVRVHWMLGDLLLRRGRFSEAAKEFEAVLAADPPQEAKDLATTGLAEAAYGKGDLDRAKSLADALLQADGRNPRANFLCGRIALDEGQIEAAVKHLDRSFTFNDYSVEAHAALAQALRRAGGSGAAEHESKAEMLRQDASRLQKASEVYYLEKNATPDQKIAWACEIAELKTRLGRSQEAMQWLSRIAEQHPQNERLRNAMQNVQRKAAP